MSRIDQATVEKIAALAHLRLSGEEVEYYQQQFERILTFMDILSAQEDSLPADWRPEFGLSPTPERPDVSNASSQVIEKVLSTAPKVVGTSFQVPRILE